MPFENNVHQSSGFEWSSSECTIRVKTDAYGEFRFSDSTKKSEDQSQSSSVRKIN